MEIVSINSETMSLAFNSLLAQIGWEALLIVKLNGSMSRGRLVMMSGVPRGPVWGPAPFSMSVNDMGSGIKFTLRKLVGDAKLCGLADMLERK